MPTPAGGCSRPHSNSLYRNENKQIVDKRNLDLPVVFLFSHFDSINTEPCRGNIVFQDSGYIVSYSPHLLYP